MASQGGQPPTAVAQIFVNGILTTSATQEGNEVVAVTFDGSKSTDDGQVVALTWLVEGLQADGSFAPAADSLRSGQVAAYEFESAGVKRVTLTVTDDAGLAATHVLPFFVNHHRVIAGVENNLHANTVSGGLSCFHVINCFDHPVSVFPGVDSARFEFSENALFVFGAHLALYAPDAQLPEGPLFPGDPPIAESQGIVLHVDGGAFAQFGTHRIAAWWNLGVNVAYTIDAFIDYTP